MEKLILITGDLATGKSTLAKRLSKELNALCFTKDVLKEILSDDIGFSSRQENKRLSVASVDVMKHIFSQYAFLRRDLILEANFHKPEITAIRSLALAQGYKIVLVFLRGEVDELFDRFTNRIQNENRHPTHCTSDIMDRAGFQKYLLDNRQELSEFTADSACTDMLVASLQVKNGNYDEVFLAALNVISSAG